MSNPRRILLDKNVARKILNGLVKAARGMVPADDERIALDLLAPESLANNRLFIVPAAANTLKHSFKAHAIVEAFREHTAILLPADYWRRWARRLQQVGFTREDARVLSLGTFGTDEKESFLGVDEVLTFDKPLVALFHEKHK